MLIGILFKSVEFAWIFGYVAYSFECKSSCYYIISSNC